MDSRFSPRYDESLLFLRKFRGRIAGDLRKACENAGTAGVAEIGGDLLDRDIWPPSPAVSIAAAIRARWQPALEAQLRLRGK